MRIILFILSISIFSIACNSSSKDQSLHTNGLVGKYDFPTLNLQQANNLAKLPLACALVEYPNKLNQTIGGEFDLKTPRDLHPSFYGCFDWHSAVHGHWSMVYLLSNFPDIENAFKMKSILMDHLTPDKIAKEVEYFQGEYNKSWERTYGWAWLLKLAEALHTWNDKDARILEGNLQPLTDLMVERYLEFLPKLVYPIRVGEHPNTAFGLSFAYDYALTCKNNSLEKAIESRVLDFYFNDFGCPISWEPGGFDFLSPCLEEAALMSKILKGEERDNWLDQFLPQLSNTSFNMDIAKVSDRTDGKLVHLDGVNFSRAWNLFEIAKRSPKKYNHLKNIANKHILASLSNIVDDAYEGGHWLGSFAIYALDKGNQAQ